MCNLEILYKRIAENIRKERKKLSISQAELAERADISVDTVKSIENGRRAMSLDTYLRIVHALETTPLALMDGKHPEQYIERFISMMNRRSKWEVEFALHMMEQLLIGRDCYLKE